MNEVDYLRQAITTNGGTPQSRRVISAWRELVTAYGGTPTRYDKIGLVRQAITAVGGSPTRWSYMPLLRELLTALGVTPGTYRLRDLLIQLSGASNGGTISLSASTIPENSATNTVIGALSVVNHASGGSGWTFAITSQTPSGKLNISGANLRVNAAIDYETNPSLSVTITASKSGQSDLVRTFTISVTDVDDTAPTITSTNAISLAENAALSHTLTANEAVTWSKTGGADAALFGLSGNTLTLTARDYESPADADANNVYVVQVTATDGAGNATNQTISVTITDVSDGGSAYDPSLLAPTTFRLEPGLGQTDTPIVLDYVFALSTISTDDAHLQVSTNAAFTALVIDTTLPVGTGDHDWGLAALVGTPKRWLRMRIERGGDYGDWSNVIVHGDTVAPTLSSPSGTQTGSTTANISVTSDEAEGVLYWTVLPAASAAPDATSIIAGGVSGSVAEGSDASPVAGSNPFAVTGLSEGTAYKAHFAQADLAANESNVVSSSSFMTADATAPTLSSPADNASGSNGYTGAVTTNEANGTLYWYVSTSGTPPSASNLKTGTGAVASGNQSVSGTGVQNVSGSGLTASTGYYIHFLHRDAAGNDSAIASGNGFTTGAAAAAIVWNPSDKATGINLSAGNTVATGTGSGWHGVRGTTSQAFGGNRYFEVTITTVNDQVCVGLSKSGAAMNTYPGDQGSVCYYNGGGVNINGGPAGGSYPSYTAGDTIGVLYKGNNVYFFKNGTCVGGGDPVAETGGLYYPETFFPYCMFNNNVSSVITAIAPTSPPAGSTAW